MRARNIKPGVFESERVGSVSMMARILYMGLWCLADRLGRLEDRPLKIKGLLFRFDPITTSDVDAALKELADQGLIIRYAVDGSRFIEVCNFLKHQTPHHKERASIIPEPTKDGASTDLGVCRPPLNPDSLIPDILNPESSLREGARRRKVAPHAPASDDFVAQVISDLNRRTGSRFETGKATTALINARRRDGATLEDFFAVHDAKVREWGKKDDMRVYLRPSTLYAASKWENYLGQAKGKLSRHKPSTPIAEAQPIDFAEVEMSDEERERAANEAKEAMAELTKRLGGQA